MQIKRLMYLEQQQSLLREERSEVRALFEVEHEGHTGFLRLDIGYDKRDADVDYFCDVPGITLDYIANTDWCWKLDEQLWSLAPVATTRTPEVDKAITQLAGHQLRN